MGAAKAAIQQAAEAGIKAIKDKSDKDLAEAKQGAAIAEARAKDDMKKQVSEKLETVVKSISGEVAATKAAAVNDLDTALKKITGGVFHDLLHEGQVQPSCTGSQRPK